MQSNHDSVLLMEVQSQLELVNLKKLTTNGFFLFVIDKWFTNDKMRILFRGRNNPIPLAIGCLLQLVVLERKLLPRVGTTEPIDGD